MGSRNLAPDLVTDPPSGPGRARRGPHRRFAALLLLLLAALLLSFAVGRSWVPPTSAMGILADQLFAVHGSWPDSMVTVVVQIRLPRILGAVAIGAALAGSGAAYQSMFRNPLVSPSILGVSAGAGFGAALGISMQLPWAVIQLMGFVGGLLATAITFLIGQLLGNSSLVVLVLAGMVVAALFGAFISLTQYFADPDSTLPQITFWLMGGLDRIALDGLLAPSILICVCLLALFLMRWQINVLAAGDDEAKTLGVNRLALWGVVVVAATLMTSCAVSLSGMIGWIGLIVPHAARIIVGPSFDRVLPASILLGGTFLLLADDLARTVTTVELPIGIVTAVVGAPCFLLLLARTRRNQL